LLSTDAKPSKWVDTRLHTVSLRYLLTLKTEKFNI
jgi:hypothetical protein